jgi:hypothetical protein
MNKMLLMPVVGGVLIWSVMFCIPLFSSGERRVGTLETIHGIPYPTEQGSISVTEKLAHADIFLQEPVLGKDAAIQITFNPGNAVEIDLGIRENDFWLGYVKVPLFRKGIDREGFQTKELHIPLSRAFQETDRSLDVMLFAKSASSSDAVEEADMDSVAWSVLSMGVRVTPHFPTMDDIQGYGKSIITRERAQ